MIRFVFKSDLSTELSRCELKGHLVTVQTDRIVSLAVNNIAEYNKSCDNVQEAHGTCDISTERQE